MSKEPNEIHNERAPDEFAAWRRLLRQPDALPGQGLADKDVAWDKLFERLSEKPRRPFYGYRIAAACILILLIPAARLFQDRKATGKMRPAMVQPVAPLASGGVRPVAPARTVMTVPGRPAAVTTPVFAARTQQGRLGHGTRLEVRQRPVKSPVVAAPQPAASAPVSIAPAQLAAVEAPPVIARPQKPAKKEWKVVDLNELDPGHQRPHEMATNRQPGLLRFGLGLGKTGMTENPPPAREEDSRLKINLTTQNR